MSTDRLSQLLHELDDLDVALPAPAPVRARGRSLRRRRQAAAATGGLGLAAAGVAAALALGGGSTQTLEQLPPAQQPTSPAVATPVPSPEPSPEEPTGSAAPTPVLTTAPTTTTSPAPATSAPPTQPTTGPSAPTAPATDDGTSMAHLVEFRDEGSSTVLVVDRVQWLTGEQARAHAAAQGRELDVEWVIANDNPLLREHPVSPDVRVTLTVPLSEAMTTDPVEVSLAELRRRLAAVSYAADIPFDVTVEDGVVVAIEQVYVP